MTQPSFPAVRPTPLVGAGLTTAGTGPRVGAYLLDSLWIGGLTIVPVLILAGVANGMMTSGDYSGALAVLTVGGFAPQLLGIVLGIAYGVMLGRGQTPGMKAAGIRLVKVDGVTAPGFWTAIGRGIIFTLSSYIIIGPFTPLMDNTGAGQGWHDKATNTWMVSATPGASGRNTALLPPPPPPARNEDDRAEPDSGPILGTIVAPPRQQAASAAPPALPPFAVPVAAPATTAVPLAVPVPAPVPVAVVAPVPVVAQPAAPSDGVISAVPGFQTRAAAPVAAPVSAPEPVPVALSISDVDEDLDRTRAVPAASVTMWLLRLDTGSQIAIDGAGYLGRNPAAPDGAPAQLIAVADTTKSISKTHLGFGVDGTRFWVMDRGSTNGTTVSRAGQPTIAVSGDVPTFVEAGDVLALGDRRIVVGTR